MIASSKRFHSSVLEHCSDERPRESDAKLISSCYKEQGWEKLLKYWLHFSMVLFFSFVLEAPHLHGTSTVHLYLSAVCRSGLFLAVILISIYRNPRAFDNRSENFAQKCTFVHWSWFFFWLLLAGLSHGPSLFFAESVENKPFLFLFFGSDKFSGVAFNDSPSALLGGVLAH